MCCTSSTPSPFGESVVDAGGAAYTPLYESMSASATGCSVARVSSVPSKAMAADVPLPSPIAVRAPRRTSATASS